VHTTIHYLAIVPLTTSPAQIASHPYQTSIFLHRGSVGNNGVGNPAVRDFYLQSHGDVVSFIINNFSQSLIVMYSEQVEPLYHYYG